MEEEANTDRERSRLMRWARNVTGIYIFVLFALLLAVLFGEVGIDSFRTMYPNEVGDLLAGIAGPFALIWLVYGYLLQGISMRQHAKEIAQSAMVLSIQVAEMEEQKKRRTNAIAPNFQFRATSSSPISDFMYEVDVEIKNTNEDVKKVKINFENNEFSIKPHLIEEIVSGSCRHVKFSFNSDVSGYIPFFVSYIDRDGESGERKFHMEIQRAYSLSITGFVFSPIYN